MIELSAKIAMLMVLLAFLFGFIRLLKGPSLPDRVVALDVIASSSAAAIIIYIILGGAFRLLDIVIIIALIVFLSTVAIAMYLKKQ